MADATIDLRIDRLEKAIQGLTDIRKNLDGIDDSVNKVEKSVEDLNTELLEQKDVIEDIRAEEKRLSALQKKGGKDYSNQLKRVRSDLIVAKNEQRKITDQIKKTISAQKQSTREANKSNLSFKKLATTLGIAFGVREIIRFGKELNRLAVQSEAFSNRAKVVFGESVKAVEEFADANAIALGLTKSEFIGAAAAIGDILVPLGLSRKAAAELSTEAVRLGTAIKRFSGDQRDASEISQIVARSFTGEVEALKGLGIVVQQNSKEFKELVKQKQRDEGITLGQAKALAIYETVVNSATDALTNLDTSSESLQATQEELDARLRQAKETIAEELTPAILILTEAWSQFLSGELFGDASKVQGVIDEILEGATSAQESFDKIVEAREFSTFRIKLLEEEVTAARLAGDRKARDSAQDALDFERKVKEELVGLEQEFANKVIEERKKVAEEGDDVAKKQIRNIAFLQEEIKKLTKANSSDLNLTRAQNIANTAKVKALRDELRLLTDINKVKQENIDLTKQQINAIDFQASGIEDRLVELLSRIEEIQKESQELQTVSVKGFQEGIIQSAQETSEELMRIDNARKQAMIDSAATILFGVTDLLQALAGEQAKYANFVKAVSVVEIIANGALAISNALATTSSQTADNVLTGGIAGLVKFATISGIILSTIANAVTSVKGSSVPQFAEGVIGLQGPGTGTSDSIPARLSRGESVMTSDETDQYRPVLESIRAGEFDKEYFDKQTIIEAAKQYENSQNKSFADNIANGLAFMGASDNSNDFYRLRQLGGNTVYYLKSIDEKLSRKDKKIR